MILRARSVVTMDGAPIADGAVVISGNRIAEVGTWKDLRAGNVGEVVDLGERVLLPGLINAHCHLDYTCLRHKISPAKSFANWIRAINAEKAKLSADDYVRSINDGFAEARRFGTTSIANLTSFPELISRTRPEIRTWWFAELIDIRDPQRAREMVEAARALQKEIGMAPHAPYTASAELFRYCEEIAEQDDVLLTTHLAESREETLMSIGGEGSLAEFLRSISGELFENAGVSPVAHLAKICRLDRRWILVHLNEICDGDLDFLGGAQVVHCPRSHAYFRHREFEFSKLRSRGVNICLGTDSLASNEDLSLFAEMRAFRGKFPDVPAENILEMATTNAGCALRMSESLGRIRHGYLADLIAIPASSGKNLFDEILGFEGAVPWLMTDGVQGQIA